MKIKTIYIDDKDEELEKYKRKFERNDLSKDRFEIITINAQRKPKDLLNEIEKHNPELILVDFDLTIPKDSVLIGISGVALSTTLRENFPDIPIVLFTRKSLFKIEKYSPMEQVLSSLDEIVYKGDVFKSDEKNLDFLYGLAVGFKELREERSKKWVDLLKIIKAPEDDYNDLKLSNPPITSKGKWSVSKAVKWIRNTLIKYPGILYDPLHSATFLGISKDAFLSEPIQKFFSKAKYSGIFAPSLKSSAD